MPKIGLVIVVNKRVGLRYSYMKSPGDINVLHVDDDPSLLELGEIYLEREDERLNVETVTKPKDAIEMLEGGNFDAVISDYDMPVMNGLDFLEEIRQDMGSDIPFIIFTGKGREEVAMDALNLGADGYVQKGRDPDSQYGMLADEIIDEVEHVRTESQFRSIIEAAPEGIATHEMVYDGEEPVNYRIIETNPAFESVTGISREEAEGELITEVCDVEEPPFMEKYSEVVETGNSMSFEAFFEPINRDFYISVSSHREGAFSTATVDISERKAREEKSKMFRGAVEQAGHAIYITDKEGTIGYVNPAFEDLTGYTAEEVLGENPRVLKSGEKGENYYEDLWKTITDGEIWEEEITNKRNDGELYTANQTISPIKSDDEIVGYVAIQDEIEK